MAGPNLSDEQYKKMPRWVKIIYWIIVAIIFSTFFYFCLRNFNIVW